MTILITIFKSQLAHNPRLIIELADFAKEVSELEEAFVYVAKQGRVVDFVNLLTQHGVSYNIHSEGDKFRL